MLVMVVAIDLWFSANQSAAIFAGVYMMNVCPTAPNVWPVIKTAKRELSGIKLAIERFRVPAANRFNQAATKI